MDRIQIVNWLLTRRCNLNCSYCRISDPKYKNRNYPSFKYFINYEMSTQYVLDSLDILKEHNPNCFHIFYGGEPFLRKDLIEIIDFCNKKNIHYTIISNNSDQVQERIIKLIDNVEVKGFTSSVDPVLFSTNYDKDRYEKSKKGLERLTKLTEKIKDVVAEVTIDRETINYLKPLLKDLTNRKISSSVTSIDIAKNDFYDFSNVTDKNLLVLPDENTKKIFDEIKQEDFNIHMGKEFLDRLFEILPSNYDCKLEEDLHNITIDSDGSLRLCLRIMGYVGLPFKIQNIFNSDLTFNKGFLELLKEDKKRFCQGCNWTCPIFSKLSQKDEYRDLVIHTKNRENENGNH